MKLNKTAVVLLLLGTLSIAQASTINYAIDITDTQSDTFIGSALYDTDLDIFTSASGALTYADGVVVNTFKTMDYSDFPGETGTSVASFSFGSTIAWVDGIIDTSNTGHGLVVLLHKAPGTHNLELDPASFIVDDHGNSNTTTSGNITSVPEPASIALLAAGMFGFGLSQRKPIK